MYHLASIVEGDVNGVVDKSSQYFDRVIAHELTHSIMDVGIPAFWTFPNFIVEGMAELTHGIDDVDDSIIMDFAKNPDVLKKALDLNIDNNILQPGINAYVAGYMFLRYLAQQGAGIVDDSLNKDKIYINKLEIITMPMKIT